jgi:molybdopterin molybdotransferase
LRLDAALALLRRDLDVVAGLETIPAAQARGRVLAAAPVATVTVPPADCAAMDGWAVRAADLGPAPLPVGGRIAAGHPLGEPARPGQAYRIFTGAPLPAGLDTVIVQEEAEERPGAVALPAARLGANIRRAGESVAPGDRPLAAGCRLGPAELGVAAALGLTTLPVRRRLRVALASTGDELHDPGPALPPGGLYDANRPMLRALLEGWGAAIDDLGIIPDRPDRLAATLAAAAAGCDLIVTSGGASVGAEDHLRGVVARLGAVSFWRLAIKPGKPVLFGRIGATPLLGLPGNPVSGLVGMGLIGRPVLARLGGEVLAPPRRFAVPAAFALRKGAGRREFPRARLTADGAADLVPNDSSGVLTSVTAADGLLDLAEDRVEIHPGEPVPFLPFAELLR